MVDAPKRTLPRLVGQYIRQKREAQGLSQRALASLFTPPVTTQFISNIERGVTPLPPTHVGILAKVLGILESELLATLEREYSIRLTGKMDSPPKDTPSVEDSQFAVLALLYEAYKRSSLETQHAFENACRTLLKINFPSLSDRDPTGGSGKTPL